MCHRVQIEKQILKYLATCTEGFFIGLDRPWRIIKTTINAEELQAYYVNNKQGFLGRNYQSQSINWSRLPQSVIDANIMVPPDAASNSSSDNSTTADCID